MASSYMLWWISALWVSLTALMFLAADGSSVRHWALPTPEARG